MMQPAVIKSNGQTMVGTGATMKYHAGEFARAASAGADMCADMVADIGVCEGVCV